MDLFNRPVIDKIFTSYPYITDEVYLYNDNKFKITSNCPNINY